MRLGGCHNTLNFDDRFYGFYRSCIRFSLTRIKRKPKKPPNEPHGACVLFEGVTFPLAPQYGPYGTDICLTQNMVGSAEVTMTSYCHCVVK
jgi:hypothetical protein